MLSFKLPLLALSSLFIASNVVADTRPDPPIERSFEEKQSLMSIGKYVRCSMSQDYLLQTKEGLPTPDNEQYSKRVLFESLAPEASSPSDFATYSLVWQNEDFDFYFYMNSQVGEIRIADKNNGYSAESDLDLSDLAKEEVYLGRTRLIQREDLLVTSPNDSELKVPVERFTYLTASCQFLEGYTP